MIFLAYLTALVFFVISDVIFGSILLAIYGAVDRFFGRHNPQSQQFFAAGLGVMLASAVGIYGFKLFSVTLNLILYLILCLVIWNLANFRIDPSHSPISQRIGVIIGLVAVYFISFKLI